MACGLWLDVACGLMWFHVAPQSLFAFAGTKGHYFAAPVFQKLQGHMAEPTDADNAYSIRWFDPRQYDRIENGDAPTKQRPGFSHIDAFWQRDRPGPVGTHIVPKTAMSANGRLPIRA